MAIEIRDGVEGKVCPVCGLWKSLNDYHRSSHSKSGRRSRCKVCHTQENITIQSDNPDWHCSKCGRRRGDFADRAEMGAEWGLDLYDGEKFGGGMGYCTVCRRVHQRKGGAGYDALLDRNARNDELELGPAFDGTPRGKLHGDEETLLNLAHEGRCTYKDAEGVRCEYTGKLDCDHVRPKTWGGHNWVWNRQPMCPEHNRNTKRNYDDKDYRQDGGAAAREIFRLGIRDEKSASRRGQYVQFIARAILYALERNLDVAEKLRGAPTISEWDGEA